MHTVGRQEIQCTQLQVQLASSLELEAVAYRVRSVRRPRILAPSEQESASSWWGCRRAVYHYDVEMVGGRYCLGRSD